MPMTCRVFLVVAVTVAGSALPAQGGPVTMRVAVSDAAGRPAMARLVAFEAGAAQTVRVDSAVTDVAGRAQLRVGGDRRVIVSLARPGDTQPRWDASLVTPERGMLALEVDPDAGVRVVRMDDTTLATTMTWWVRAQYALRDTSAAAEPARRSARADGTRLLDRTLPPLGRQAVIHGMTALEGPRLAPEQARRFLRELDGRSPYWASLAFPSVLLPLLRTAEGWGAAMDATHVTRFVAVADSLIAADRVSATATDELLAMSAMFLHRQRDSVGARARWRRIEGSRPASHVLPSLRAVLAPDRPVRRGAPLPNVTYADVRTGAPVELAASSAAKATLVDLWAVWCGPCIVERPILVQAYATWKSKGFDIVSVGFDDSVAVERQYLSARPELAWRHLLPPVQGRESRWETARRFGVFGIPRWILVDGAGRVLEEQVVPTAAALDAVLARHLGAP